MAEIKMYVADTIDLVQKWVNEHNLDYDSIKLQCHSCDNSTSGAVFTVYGREGNKANSKTANCAIFDVSKSYCGEQGEDNMKADIKEIMHACGDKFDFIRLCNEAQEELDEATFDLDQESRMNGV